MTASPDRAALFVSPAHGADNVAREPDSPSHRGAMTNTYLIGAYLDWLRARRVAPSTIRTAAYILKGFAASVPRPLDELTHADLNAWHSARSRTLSARTQRSYGSYIHGFYRWALDEGHVSLDPTTRVRTPKVGRLLPRPIAEDRLSRALDSGDDIMRAILALAAFAGLRACEVASLTWEDVCLDGDEPYLRVVGKGSRERVMDVSPELREILLATPSVRRRRGPVIRRADGEPGFNSPTRISQMANLHLRAAGVPDTYHALRHRFLTAVCKVGGLRNAQEAAGHASATTTAGYAAVARRDLGPIIREVGRVLAS